MAVRKIIQESNILLRKISEPVENFDDGLVLLLEDLKDTLNDTKYGVGLAAIQIGVLKRVCIIVENGKLLEIINPKILNQSGAQELMEEGCLSVKNANTDGVVARSKRIRIEFQDRSGKIHQRERKGFAARCILHEIDHMDGILFTDRMEKNA